MKSYSFILLALLIVTGCAPKQEAPTTEVDAAEIMTSYEDITPEQLNEITANDPDVIVLDVRTDAEVANGMIEGAIQIDYQSEDFRDQIAQLDSTKTYIVYCHRGGRSAATCEILTQELGFDKVKNLEGGYSGYSASE